MDIGMIWLLMLLRYPRILPNASSDAWNELDEDKRCREPVKTKQTELETKAGSSAQPHM